MKNLNRIDRFLIRKIKVLLIVILMGVIANPAYQVFEGVVTNIVNGRQEVPTHFKDKLVKVYVGNGVCSGTKLGKSFVLTAAHCISKPGSVYKVIDIKQESTLRHTDYVAYKVHPRSDIAILVTRKGPVQKLDTSLLEFTPIKKGDKVFVLGTNSFSKASEVLMKPITVDRPLFFNGFRSLWGHGLDIQGGTSGGAVINGQGKIVGVLVMGMGPTLNGITPIDELKGWLK